MAFFFADSSGVENRGRVQMLAPPGAAAPGSIVSIVAPGAEARGLQDLHWGGFANFKSLITNVVISESVSAQFQHMLGDDIYATTFGDRMGSLGIGGVAAYDNCGDNGDQQLGISHVLRYYRAAKMDKRAAPMKVTLAPDTVFQGFLHRFRGQVLDVTQRLFQFHLDLALVPDDVPGELDVAESIGERISRA